MILYILLAIAVLILLVSAVAFVGSDRFIALWNALPAQARTIVNVSVGALIAWALSDGVQLLLALDMPTWLKILLAGVSTAVVRAANPADDAYGKVIQGQIVTPDDEAVDDEQLPPVVD